MIRSLPLQTDGQYEARVIFFLRSRGGSATFAAIAAGAPTLRVNPDTGRPPPGFYGRFIRARPHLFQFGDHPKQDVRLIIADAALAAQPAPPTWDCQLCGIPRMDSAAQHQQHLDGARHRRAAAAAEQIAAAEAARAARAQPRRPAAAAPGAPPWGCAVCGIAGRSLMLP